MNNSEKHCLIIYNALKPDQWRKILTLLIFEIVIRQGDQIFQLFYKLDSPKKLAPPLFSLRIFLKTEKTTAKSWRMHWNRRHSICVLQNFKFEIQKWDQKIQSFCRIGSCKKLGSPFLISENFRKLGKVLLNHVKCIEIL